MTNEEGDEKRTLLVRSDEAKDYTDRGYTVLASIQRGGEGYTLLQEPDRPLIPRYFPPKTSSGLLEEN